MICSICGKDERCYSLMEVDMKGFQIRPAGMIFNICSSDLDRLVALIKTNKTILDDPSKPVNFRELRSKMGSDTKHTIASNDNGKLTVEER